MTLNQLQIRAVNRALDSYTSELSDIWEATYIECNKLGNYEALDSIRAEQKLLSKIRSEYRKKIN